LLLLQLLVETWQAAAPRCSGLQRRATATILLLVLPPLLLLRVQWQKGWHVMLWTQIVMQRQQQQRQRLVWQQ
jgi:hypothetical protein